MPIGAFKLNGIGKFTVTAVAQVLRAKKGIQAFGNAQVSTAQSQFGGSSFLGDGTGDYLLITSHSDFAFGTGDFTIEAWVRPTNFTSGPIIVDFRTGDPQICPTLYINTSGVVLYYTNGATRITGSTLSINTWYHIALCRSSASTKLFVNGTQVGSTYSDTNNYVEKPAYISAYGGGTTFGNLNGYIDEFRISKSARYTANFTPSTTPFVNDANTVLLLHMDGTNTSTFFEDDNGTGRSQIRVGAGNQTQISTAQSNFGGGSALFDGSSDFLTVSDLPSFVSSDYTFECWARFDILPHNQTLGGGSYMILAYGGGNDYFLIYRSGASGSQMAMQIAHAGAYGSFTKSGVNYAINTWYHIAVVRNSGVFKVFFNGTDLTTFTNDSGFTNSGRTQNIFTGQLGKFSDSRGSWDGYMDEIRISNSARYTGDFTPSTTPFVNDANTKLLLHMNGTNASTVFRDDNGVGRSQVGFSAIGNAQVDTAQSKFGGASALFDGTGDLLQADTTASLTIASSEDFTIEGWIRPGSVSGTPGLLTDRASSNSLAGVNWDISIFNGTYITSRTNTLLFETGSGAGSIVIISNNNVFTINTWYHFAVVRSSNVITLYVNGTDVTNNRTGTQSSAIGAGNLTMGGFPNGALMYTGHMDEIRFSISARYTAGFTPSTTPFVNDANTALLLHMDGTDASTVFTDDNGVYPA